MADPVASAVMSGSGPVLTGVTHATGDNAL